MVKPPMSEPTPGGVTYRPFVIDSVPLTRMSAVRVKVVPLRLYVTLSMELPAKLGATVARTAAKEMRDFRMNIFIPFKAMTQVQVSPLDQTGQ